MAATIRPHNSGLARLGAARLAQAKAVFKHIPYNVKAR
jgi:hypothetical protein